MKPNFLTTKLCEILYFYQYCFYGWTSRELLLNRALNRVEFFMFFKQYKKLSSVKAKPYKITIFQEGLSLIKSKSVSNPI